MKVSSKPATTVFKKSPIQYLNKAAVINLCVLMCVLRGLRREESDL